MRYKIEMIERAGAFEKAQDWQGLFNFCTAWTDEEPMNFLAWKGVGDGLRKLNRTADAVLMYHKSLSMVPPSPDEYFGPLFSAGPVWYSLGRAYIELGDRGNAIAALSEAAKIDPDEAIIWNDLGYVYVSMEPRDSKAAFGAFKKAVDIDPQNFDGLKNLGLLYAMAGLKEGVESIAKMLLISEDPMLPMSKRTKSRDFLKEANEILRSTR
jgi:tetratricopeptide (TPR) repeat protein